LSILLDVFGGLAILETTDDVVPKGQGHHMAADVVPKGQGHHMADASVASKSPIFFLHGNLAQTR
jgi:hypothetical protein